MTEKASKNFAEGQWRTAQPPRRGPRGRRPEGGERHAAAAPNALELEKESSDFSGADFERAFLMNRVSQSLFSPFDPFSKSCSGSVTTD